MDLINHTQPFPYLHFKNFYTEEELSLIWTELDFLQSNPETFKSENTNGAKGDDGKLLKKNTGMFLDEMYNDRFRCASNILNCNRKLFDHIRVNNWFFKNLTVDKDTTLVSYYENSDYYHPHKDNTVATACTWFFKEPKKFKGGDFCFPEFNIEIPVENNSLVVFPGHMIHAVTQIEMEDDSPGYGRYCMSQFLNWR